MVLPLWFTITAVVLAVIFIGGLGFGLLVIIQNNLLTILLVGSGLLILSRTKWWEKNIKKRLK